METYIFVAFGIFMVLGVIITLVKMTRGTANSARGGGASSEDRETSRLCKTLGGEELYNLAVNLKDEKGHKKDYKLWDSFMSASANKGYVPAMREWGKDRKCIKNNEAIFWLERAANEGDALSAVALGDMYKFGVKYGTPIIEKNEDLALKWYTVYAEKGDATAQFELGEFLQYYKHNEKEALQWYKKSADQNNADAINALADYYRFNDKEEKAFEMDMKAAELGSAEAERSLGTYYYTLDKPDYEKAMEWYKKAAEHGDSVATCDVGIMYLKGKGILKDPYTAVKWFKKAKDISSVQATYYLGKCYFDGTGIAQNTDEAIKLYKEVADYSANAQYELGICYLEGTGVKKDVNQAIKYLKKSSEARFYNSSASSASYKLGELYYEGKLVKKNDDLAKEYWRKSASHANKDAIECLKIYFGEVVEIDEDEIDDFDD